MRNRLGRLLGVMLLVTTAMVLGQSPPAEIRIDPANPDPAPRTPEETRRSIRVPEGFTVELVAAEPLVLDPTAFDWGPDGKLWVVEMADYPLGMDGKMKAGGRVVYLEDTNADGKYDKRTVFLDGVNFPNGILVWRKGVLVTAAPEIFYAEDTDGDGRADLRKTLITGFVEGNPQLRINGLRYGLDNWIYCANGLTNSPKIRNAMRNEEIALGSRDLRFRPDTGEVEPQSGASQFGRNRDDYGNWFGVHNSFPMWHYVLEDHYIRRNPHVASPDPKQQLRLPRNPPIYPLSRHVHFYDHPHRGSLVTSTCGQMIYRDDQVWPRGEMMHGLSCEPHHNLIVHTLIKPDGVSFSGERVEQESEFLASDDFWFKPVMARTGPDGAIWIADFYRYFVEHPQYMPKEHRERLAPLYRAGDDRGRIWRVYRKDAPPRRIERLDRLSSAELMKVLEHPNGEVRDLAQRMLVWRDDASAVGPLRQVMGSPAGVARLHALCTLEGMGELRPQDVQAALADDHAAVRRQAVRIAEAMAAKHPEVLAAALKLASDPDAKVRLQLACSIGQWEGEEAGRALARIAAADSGDPYMVAAVMTSAVPHCRTMVNALVADGEVPPALAQPLLSTALGLNERDAAAKLLRPMLADSKPTPQRFEALVAALDAIARQKTTVEKLKLAAADDALVTELAKLSSTLDHSRSLAARSDVDPALRLAAINLLGRDAPTRAIDVRHLLPLVAPQVLPQVQAAAVKALGRMGDLYAAEKLLAAWSSHGPTTRSAIADEMVGRAPWATKLLEQIEAGRIGAGELDASRRERLLTHATAAVRNKAKEILGGNGTGSRAQVVASFQDALSLKGDAARGKIVFARACAICHKLDDVGRDIGPNLRSITDRSPAGLLSAILDPNAGVEPRYTSYTCELNSGEVLFGIISAESGSSVTLIGLDGAPRSVLRTDIRRLASTNRSLMPEGLEAAMSRQDLADLIEFVRGE